MTEMVKGAEYTITPKLREQGTEAALDEALRYVRVQMVRLLESAGERDFFHIIGYKETPDG